MFLNMVFSPTDNAELIAIHSFCKSKDEGLVIAVILVKVKYLHSISKQGSVLINDNNTTDLGLNTQE